MRVDREKSDEGGRREKGERCEWNERGMIQRRGRGERSEGKRTERRERKERGERGKEGEGKGKKGGEKEGGERGRGEGEGSLSFCTDAAPINPIQAS